MAKKVNIKFTYCEKQLLLDTNFNLKIKVKKEKINNKSE